MSEQEILDASVEAIMKAIRESGQDMGVMLDTLRKLNDRLEKGQRKAS